MERPKFEGGLSSLAQRVANLFIHDDLATRVLSYVRERAPDERLARVHFVEGIAFFLVFVGRDQVLAFGASDQRLKLRPGGAGENAEGVALEAENLRVQLAFLTGKLPIKLIDILVNGD